jgi:hypothetical protein
MHKLEAIKILEAKLAAIEREHRAEFASDEDMRDQADSTAEAKAACGGNRFFEGLQNHSQ